jgi:hypothetical protein
MVIICQLAHVGTFVEAVGQGCVRFGRLGRHTVGEMSSGSGSKEDDGLGDVVDDVVPMEITFMDNGGNVFVLYEFIDHMNSYIV